MTDLPRLVLIKGPDVGQTFSIDQSPVALGRDPRNDVVIDHPEVSRQHARIVEQEGVWLIEDLDSTNGTFVNDIPVTEPHALKTGDVIETSKAVALVYREGDAASRGARSPAGSSSFPQRPPERVTAPRGAPSPDRAPPASLPPQAEAARAPGQRWLWVGLGCLLLLLALACAAIFLLDYLQLLPAAFYAPLRWLGLI